MALSILHLSDLHRSAEDPISNAELIESLVTDRVRYTKGAEPVAAPNAVVVSGDIIQGVGLGHVAPGEELARQYRVAEEFLASLADEFLAGDRSKLIIAPGNHDVDWNLARRAMELMPEDAKIRPADALNVESDLRWSWSERRFYKVVDKLLYAQRFDAYWDFVESFYRGVTGIPKLSRDSKFAVFQLDGSQVGVAVFNSCHHNDCFAFHGAIEKSVIAEASKFMRQGHNFKLWMAAWHHSVHGTPYRNDYMDISQVQDMVGYGFRLGVHGHQHKHQVLPTSVHLPEEEKMAVISAGSLCAGPKELPTGTYRQYNIIDVDEGLQGARVHVRQMETGRLFSPCHLTSAGGKAFVDVHWSPSLNIDSSRHAPDAVIFEAELAGAKGNFSAALALLMPLGAGISGFPRALLLENAVKANAWGVIVDRFGAPQTIHELVAFVEACDRLNKSAEGLHALTAHAEQLEMPPPQRAELRARLQIRSGGAK